MFINLKLSTFQMSQVNLESVKGIQTKKNNWFKKIQQYFK